MYIHPQVFLHKMLSFDNKQDNENGASLNPSSNALFGVYLAKLFLLRAIILQNDSYQNKHKDE